MDHLPYIFISHSSKDEDIAEKLVTVIENTFFDGVDQQIKKSFITCTSHGKYGINDGILADEILKRLIKKERKRSFFFILLTENFNDGGGWLTLEAGIALASVEDLKNIIILDLLPKGIEIPRAFDAFFGRLIRTTEWENTTQFTNRLEAIIEKLPKSEKSIKISTHDVNNFIERLDKKEKK